MGPRSNACIPESTLDFSRITVPVSIMLGGILTALTFLLPSPSWMAYDTKQFLIVASQLWPLLVSTLLKLHDNLHEAIGSCRYPFHAGAEKDARLLYMLKGSTAFHHSFVAYTQTVNNMESNLKVIIVGGVISGLILSLS